VSWQRDGTLRLNPDFQRRSVWKKGAKSYFIDTILKGFPVPIIFMRDMRSDLRSLKSQREVVDGQQRIRTLLAYIDQDLLPDFDVDRDEFVINKSHNKELGGQAFADLDDEYRQKILDYQFSVHSFPADTDDRMILQIFARMNATGYKLTHQELRNAQFYGAFKTLVYELATEQLHRWRAWKIFNADGIARMNEVELTSELIMLITHGIMDKRQAEIDSYYKEYEDDYPFAKEVSRRVRAVFHEIDERFDQERIGLLFNRRTIFYSLFAAIYGIQYGLRNAIPVSKADPPALNRVKAAPLSHELTEQFLSAAIAIKEGDVSAEVAKASRGASSDASQRKVIIKHLSGPDYDPCRNLH
jgi:hypothetical protein